MREGKKWKRAPPSLAVTIYKKKTQNKCMVFRFKWNQKKHQHCKKNTQITQSIDTTYVSNELLPLPIHIYIVQQYTFVST